MNDTETTTEETTPVDGGAEVEQEPDSPTTTTEESTETSSDVTRQDAFPREVVEKLRHENAKYRQRAQQSDGLAQRLHTELVRATGRLADPTDLEFDEAHLGDADALATALDTLLEAKPHLASRRPVGDIGQGRRGAPGEPFSLLGLLKERT